MPVIKLILEGLGLGFLLYLMCAIRNGARGMVHMRDQKVQERAVQPGMTTQEAIERRSALFRGLCLPACMAYVLVCVWEINETRGFWNLFRAGCMGMTMVSLSDFIILDCWLPPKAKPFIKGAEHCRAWKRWE